jgi:hypothetical protein
MHSLTRRPSKRASDCCRLRMPWIRWSLVTRSRLFSEPSPSSSREEILRSVVAVSGTLSKLVPFASGSMSAAGVAGKEWSGSFSFSKEKCES